MKGSDRILLLIVGAVALLLFAAFAFVLLRPEPEYMAEDTPAGVVHNYLLALRREEYERAYGYISEEAQIADLDDFIDSVESRWSFDLGSDVGLSVEDIFLSGEDSARVQVRKSHTSNDLFGGSQYSNTFTVRLQKEGGAWRITESGSYWDRCWDQDADCS